MGHGRANRVRQAIDHSLGEPARSAFTSSRVEARPFVISGRATVADLSMCAYLSCPADKTGYDLATSHPRVYAWLGRIAALLGWRAPYDFLPGQRLRRFDQAAGPPAGGTGAIAS